MTEKPASGDAFDLRFLHGYPPALLARVRDLLEGDRLGEHLARRYPGRHEIQSDKALYTYVNDWRQQWLRHAPQLDRVRYDSTLDVIENALGQHERRSRNHGGRLQTRREIRIASLFRQLAPEFLEMIVVHELAHLKVMAHDRSFYQLCEHMLPDYAQREFDLRLHLTWQQHAAR